MNTVIDKINYMEWYAEEYDIPIMQKDSIKYISDIINEKGFKHILELGTAIGYSSICIASINENIDITTIERNEERYNEAIKNIKDINYDNRVIVIFDDALNVNLTDKYDLIIIDASKGKNIDFFNKYKENLKDNGYMVFDNMNFHGLVGTSQNIESKNLRSLVRKIEVFREFISVQEGYNVSFIEVGDGLAVCKKDI